jgi:hypothetical protein
MQRIADPLQIRGASRFVMQRAMDVRIDRHQMQLIAEQIRHTPPPRQASTWQLDHLGSHQLSRNELANYVLVLDALNFCFWGEPRWRVTRDGRTENGYWGLTLALQRALDEDYPITSGRELASISSTNVARMLRGESVIPLFSARVHNLQEAGAGLGIHSDESFAQCIDQSAGSAIELFQQVITRFPSFVDVRTYQGRSIPFYKRAQILISDLAAAFASSGEEIFDDLTWLTAFADYKVPQVLHQLGILRYSPRLEAALRNHQLIAPNDTWEVEIRAATIVAVADLAAASSTPDHPIPEYAIDWHLWNLGQTDSADRLPYHRTITIAY